LKRFFIVLALIAVVALLMWVITPAGATAFGMPVACYGNMEDGTFCWITLGGFGVLVLGAGVGLVEIGLIGAGLLFAVGQATVGLIAFGQVVLGPVFYCAQGGLGLVGLGQGGAGLYTIKQGSTGGEGRKFLDQLDEELNELLKFS